LDYKDHLSSIVWIAGCNMRCDYCYNKDIVFCKEPSMSFVDVLSFLDTRIGLLDSVVISGGEATNQNLLEFCKEVKKRDFKIKLDTNGINFKQIKELIDLKLIDYIALDYKAPKYKFANITHCSILKFDNFILTLEYLIKQNFDFEVRTTIHKDILDEDDINYILDDLSSRGYCGDYFLQNYFHTETNIGMLKKPKANFDYELIKEKNSIITVKYRNF